MKVKFNIKADTPNKNGTIYPKKVLKKAMKEYIKRIKDRREFGIIDQPKFTTPLTEIAFRINDVIENDGGYVAEINILSTPNGDKLKEIIDKNEYRIVTLSYGDITKDKDGNDVVSNLEIAQVGIKPKKDCV